MTAPSWQRLPDETAVRTSPVWFQLVDRVTGRAPQASVDVLLDRLNPLTGRWVAAGARPSVTGAGAVAVLGLESRPRALGEPPRRYRIRVTGDAYIPLYRRTAEGVEFVVPSPITRQDLVLLPSVAYPYPPEEPVLRGVVRDVAGDPVPDVEVSSRVQAGAQRRTELTLTDGRGVFALSLLWVPRGSDATVVALHRRTGRTATVRVAVPSDLSQSLPITIA